MEVNDTFVISTRSRLPDGSYGSEPGETQFLRVPRSAETYDASQSISRDLWQREVVTSATGARSTLTGLRGDVLVFIHGYNNEIDSVLWRTRKLQDTLAIAGWKGRVVAFDWPSNNNTLNYLEDRSDAAAVASRLVSEVIPMLVPPNDGKCVLNVHLIGHSTGAYVIQEAFSRAMAAGSLFQNDWRIAQVALIGGDISAQSLDVDAQWSQPMLSRACRLTNYQNRHDSVLAVSNAKRYGTSPRVGRVGLTPRAHPKCVNVDCTAYFEAKDPKHSVYRGTFCHSWHIGDPAFALDLALTLEGESDRFALPSRTTVDGALCLRMGTRNEYQAHWTDELPPPASEMHR